MDSGTDDGNSGFGVDFGNNVEVMGSGVENLDGGVNDVEEMGDSVTVVEQ